MASQVRLCSSFSSISIVRVFPRQACAALKLECIGCRGQASCVEDEASSFLSTRSQTPRLSHAPLSELTASVRTSKLAWLCLAGCIFWPMPLLWELLGSEQIGLVRSNGASPSVLVSCALAACRLLQWPIWLMPLAGLGFQPIALSPA